MNGTKSPKQKKLGVRPDIHRKYSDTARKTRRSMVEVADLAIDLYRETVGLSKPKSAAASPAA